MKIIYIMNLLRTLPIWLLIKLCKVQHILRDDMKGYAYCVDPENKLNDFVRFNRLIARKKLFHNVVVYRIRGKK